MKSLILALAIALSPTPAIAYDPIDEAAISVAYAYCRQQRGADPESIERVLRASLRSKGLPLSMAGDHLVWVRVHQILNRYPCSFLWPQ